jgi:hypothetical protein
MDMTKEALQFQMEQFSPKTMEIGGAIYTTKPLHRVELPMPTELKVKSLKAIVDFVEADIDVDEDIYIHIVDPKNVAVYAGLNADRNRSCLVHAQAGPTRMRFDSFMDAESFVIALQAQFADGENTDKAKLLSYVGTLKEVHESTMADDGVSQMATVKTGIATVGEKAAPNPVMLAPYRTFIEVEQPASKFVLRLKEGGGVALFEADGGAWERVAVENIRAYLETALEAGDACRAFKVVILA